nr:random slug protein 5 [Ipomoea trifida]
MTSYLRKTFSSTFGSSAEKGKKENKASPPPEADEIPYNDHDSEASDVESSRGNCAEKEEVERSKIGIMRAVVQREDPSAKDVDDLMIRRFLRARDLDVEKASAMFLKYLSWRREFLPKGSISPSEIPNDLAQNKMFMQGKDKLGRPIVVVYGGRHKQTTLDEFKRFVTFSLDTISSRMPDGQEKFVSIADLEGWGYANSDIRGYLAALSILQDCYPERLGKLFIVHVPYIFMTAWKVIYPFIDSRTKKKIIFVENKKMKSTLLRDIDESQLPEAYGGKLPLVPIHDC